MNIDNVTIDFILDNYAYVLKITALDSGYDSYAMHLYVQVQTEIDDIYNIRNMSEVFSTWIDSDGGEVTGNQEIYKAGFNKAIEKSYNIFNKLIEE